MKGIKGIFRKSRNLRFSDATWEVITERATALFGSEKSRARYLEDLALKEAQQNETR